MVTDTNWGMGGILEIDPRRRACTCCCGCSCKSDGRTWASASSVAATMAVVEVYAPQPIGE